MENENIQAQTPTKKKSKKKWIIIAVVLVLFVAIAASGSSEPTVETPSGDISASQSAETDKKEEPTSASTNEIKVGSSVSNNHVKITFKSCNSDFKNYSQYADIKSGHKVIQAIFDFENISSSDIFLEGFECYADGAKCERFYYVDDYSDPIFKSISAGRKLTDATVYYEVPADAETIELEYQANIWNDDKYIFVVE